MANDHVAPVNLLWTGGWDSTFQLLRLLLVFRLPVRPIYVLDETRGSTQVEIRTMDRIRERLGAMDPCTRKLMLPTVYGSVTELLPAPGIDEAFRRLGRRCPIGSQYAWLAKFCRQHGLVEVETGFEKTRSGAGALLIDLGVEGVSSAGYPVHRVARGEQHADVLTIFGDYAFPLFTITKQDMALEVDARGWRPIMHDTWFCHRPVDLQPCATCSPCHGVVKAGLGWRIPPRRRAIGALHRATIGVAKSVAKRWLNGLSGPVLTRDPLLAPGGSARPAAAVADLPVSLTSLLPGRGHAEAAGTMPVPEDGHA